MTKSTQMCSLKVIFYSICSLHLIMEFHDSVIKITSYNSCCIVFLCLLHISHSIFTQNGKCSTNIYSVYSIYSFTYHLSISVILKILPDSNSVFLNNQFKLKYLLLHSCRKTFTQFTHCWLNRYSVSTLSSC